MEIEGLTLHTHKHSDKKKQRLNGFVILLQLDQLFIPQIHDFWQSEFMPTF
jgi:hypothetical protein